MYNFWYIEIKKIDKTNRTPELINQLLLLWENHVKTTHKFLSEEEIENIKKYVPKAMKDVSVLIVVKKR